MSKPITTPLRTSLLSSQPSNSTRREVASPILASPFKRKTMTITQTYYLAHKARAKLSSEAGRPDHNLRLLVGHANLLDSLMLELADAEREQESWFNQSVRGATAKSPSTDRHVQWADTVVEDPEEDWRAEDADSDDGDSSSDSDSDVDYEEDDVEMADLVSLRRVASHQHRELSAMEEDEDEDDFEDEDDEDYPHLALSRIPSHSADVALAVAAAQLPELDHDSDSSEDESMPPSPPTAVLETFSEKQTDKSAYYDSRREEHDHQKAFYDEGFYLPPRNPARLVTAISVY